MKICILDPSYKYSDSPLKEVDTPCDPTPYLKGHTCERVQIHKATAVRQLIELSHQNFDLFFNLCDGAWDEDRPGIEVVLTLERLGLAFTGADSGFYEPSREAMKRVCHYWGIPTPPHVMARADEDIERAASTLRFPLIVKHPCSYSSIGLTRKSKVRNSDELRHQANAMRLNFGGALIEEFIEGREFTVLVAENPEDPFAPTAYPPVEFFFPAGESFKHFEMKWVLYDDMECDVCSDSGLSERLQEISRQFFVGLNGTGYGRCDIRVDSAGNPYMLEINPNCGVFYPPDDPGSADVVLASEPGGHERFVDQIVQAALQRCERRRKRWEVRLEGDRGYGMYAVSEIAEGQLIDEFEEQACHLVSRKHVERNWDPLRVSWFDRYAYPLSEEVWAIWNRNPEEWRPLNHSCDPNAWLDGLNLVARRPIQAREEITVDYATFCGESMPPFDCFCESSNCRGVIKGTDCLEPFLEAYGDHVSDYVRTLREELDWANQKKGKLVSRYRVERYRRRRSR